MLKTVCQNTLPFHSHRDITARFDGGSLTSDAGWLLFGSLDRQHRLCEGFSFWVHLSSAFPEQPLFHLRLESPELQLASPSSPKNRFRHSSRPRSV